MRSISEYVDMGLEVATAEQDYGVQRGAARGARAPRAR